MAGDRSKRARIVALIPRRHSPSLPINRPDKRRFHLRRARRVLSGCRQGQPRRSKTEYGKGFSIFVQKIGNCFLFGKFLHKGRFALATSRYAPQLGKVAEKKYFNAPLNRSIKLRSDGPNSAFHPYLNRSRSNGGISLCFLLDTTG
jgi:hypothetical protein